MAVSSWALARQGIGASSSDAGSDTAYGVNVGYRLSRNFAVEGAYAYVGKFGYDAAVSAPSAQRSWSGSRRSPATSARSATDPPRCHQKAAGQPRDTQKNPRFVSR